MRRRGWPETPRPKSPTRKWTNKRTGQVVDVPAGIDPGFERNVGQISPVAAAQQVLNAKIAAASPAIAQAAKKPTSAADYAVEGNLVRKGIGIDPAADPAAFRAELLRRLRQQRDAGGATANVQPATGGAASKAAAKLVADASRLLPRPWVEAANAASHLVARRVGGNGGGYYEYFGRRVTLLGPKAGPDVALHEYVHHLQATLPGFQRVFREEHIRRTTDAAGKRHPKTKHWFGPGRDDKYAKDLVYMGRDYGKKTQSSHAPAQHDMPDGDAQEVATVAHQVVLESHHGKEMLGKLAQADPGMLDLVLGMLFRFDP